MGDQTKQIVEYRRPGTHNRTRLWVSWALLLLALAVLVVGGVCYELARAVLKGS